MDPLIDWQFQQYAHAYILHVINTALFLDYSTNIYISDGYFCWRTFDAYGVMSWGSVVFAFLCMELYKVFYDTNFTVL